MIVFAYFCLLLPSFYSVWLLLGNKKADLTVCFFIAENAVTEQMPACRLVLRLSLDFLVPPLQERAKYSIITVSLTERNVL